MQATTQCGPFVRLAVVTFGLAVGCHSSGGTKSAPDSGAPGTAGTDTGSAGTASMIGPTDGSSPSAGVVVGQLDSAPATKLPKLPKLSGVIATQREDSVGIDFNPTDDAMDYRVYPLPADGDITVNANGSIKVKNAIYRCAGVRQTFDIPTNLNSVTTNGMTTPMPGLDLAIGGGVYPPVLAQVPSSPTLGYVYVEPGSGRVPVYAIGVYPASREWGWRETRPKIYTTDSSQRQMLLGQGGRDDGIAFYVPADAASGTQTIYHSETLMMAQHTEFYFGDAGQASHATDTTPPAPAFQVLSATAAGAVPLMSVFYLASQEHTELAAGKERFNRASKQGPGPLWHVEWSGVTKSTVLVVEALAHGCPYQGFVAPQAVTSPPHQPLFTLDQVQKASTNGEVFINGEYDYPGITPSSEVIDAGAATLTTPDVSPVPIARSFVQVAPQPHDASAYDWYEGFAGNDFGTMTPVADTPSCPCQTADAPGPCNSGSGACGYWTSPKLNVGMYEVDNPNNVALFASGQVLGQFWDAFDDWGQDVTATIRFTSPQQATLSTDPDKFLHVTWTVNTVGTDRRYPQLIVSDQPTPVQDGFKNPDSNFLLIQTIDGPSMRFQVEAFHGLFNGKQWAVNNQAPYHALIDYETSDTTSIGGRPPSEPPLEHSGTDRMTKYDAYISSSVLYVFMDGAPAGCTKYPANGYALSGQVSVTFGDVMYHEGAPDELVCYQTRPYEFMHKHQCTENERLWDDLGFKSGVVAPKWDTNLFPCSDY